MEIDLYQNITIYYCEKLYLSGLNYHLLLDIRFNFNFNLNLLHLFLLLVKQYLPLLKYLKIPIIYYY